jgi:hypothetical protein
VTPADYNLMSKFEQGTSTLVTGARSRTRPGVRQDHGRIAAAQECGVDQPAGDADRTRDPGGSTLPIGPCDRTPAGRQTLDQGRASTPPRSID